MRMMRRLVSPWVLPSGAAAAKASAPHAVCATSAQIRGLSCGKGGSSKVQQHLKASDIRSSVGVSSPHRSPYQKLLQQLAKDSRSNSDRRGATERAAAVDAQLKGRLVKQMWRSLRAHKPKHFEELVEDYLSRRLPPDEVSLTLQLYGPLIRREPHIEKAWEALWQMKALGVHPTLIRFNQELPSSSLLSLQDLRALWPVAVAATAAYVAASLSDKTLFAPCELKSRRSEGEFMALSGCSGRSSRTSLMALIAEDEENMNLAAHCTPNSSGDDCWERYFNVPGVPRHLAGLTFSRGHLRLGTNKGGKGVRRDASRKFP
ncbi:hypothetical protein cyc_06780 [Cyclospora cayetanensis]|uniref:Uncharacterized protein n=1 Tax=Cyclospora cayetanensis TaxID=88456 RepID=A0A1D3CS85_9EIME|nr:hypothetical protein cyc_06780 [Cyclospora cayetanensis]